MLIWDFKQYTLLEKWESLAFLRYTKKIAKKMLFRYFLLMVADSRESLVLEYFLHMHY